MTKTTAASFIANIFNCEESHYDAAFIHAGIASDVDFGKWMRAKIKKYNLVEGSDYWVVTRNGRRDYVVTNETALDLILTDTTPVSKVARQYLINMEAAHTLMAA